MSKNQQERRFNGLAELRMEGDEESRLLVGFPIVYNVRSEDLGGFYEFIRPGAFKKALESADVRCLIDHNPTLLLGRNTAGTLRLFDEPKGLRMECDLDDTSYALDLRKTVKRKDRTGMSFGFTAIEDQWEMDKDGCMVRSVIEADVFDVSAVTYPAYTETSLALRSLDSWKRHQPGPNENRLLLLNLRERSYRPR